MLYILYIMCFCNIVSWKKKNITKKIIRMRKYIYSTVCFLEKNLYVSRLIQFKPMLFEGQL